MTEMKVCVPVSDDQVVGGWGKAQRVAVAVVEQGVVLSWEEIDVRWDLSHDEGTEGSHHARIVRFLREHDVEVVVTHHMGAPMANTIDKMGIRVVREASGDARAAVLAAV
jgi:predicted Fe-Mo cluster-binding NifX family protein